MPVDPPLQAALDQLLANGGPKLHEVGPEQARVFYDAMNVPRPDLVVGEIEDARLPGPAGEIPIRIYRPVAGKDRPCLVYYHGGGWVIGSIETHDPVCRDLAIRSGCTVISVEYRLAPEARYPAAAEDCYAALEGIAAGAREFGVDANRLAVGGDSAGGNLAAVVALMARDRGGPALRFQLLVYPVTDVDFERPSYLDNGEGYLLEADSMKWFWDLYTPDPATRSQGYAAPQRAEDLSGLPPALVVTAEYDPLRDEGEAYAKRLEAAGVETTLTRYDGLIHGFLAFGLVTPRADAALGDCAAATARALR